ncbi:hypothetical protein DITRI_Ditri02bG0118200 [Diplodiscus trichospermus]
MIIGSNGVQRLLRADSNSPDINCGSGEHWQCRFFALEIEFSSLFSFHLTFCEAQLLLALEVMLFYCIPFFCVSIICKVLTLD